MMPIELWCLFGALVLGLVHIGAASFAFKGQVGNAYTMGARDEGIPPQGLAGRLDRALRNFLETFPIFAVAIVMLHLLDRNGALSAIGAALYLFGRIIYLPLYGLGTNVLRTLCWAAATFGLALVMIQIVL